MSTLKHPLTLFKIAETPIALLLRFSIIIMGLLDEEKGNIIPTNSRGESLEQGLTEADELIQTINSEHLADLEEEHRLQWAGTGTKDPKASDVLYIAAPNTINTMPAETLLDFADHGKINDLFPVNGGNAEETLSRFVKAGVGHAALAEQLRKEGAQSFDHSWKDLLDSMASKSNAPVKATLTKGK